MSIRRRVMLTVAAAGLPVGMLVGAPSSSADCTDASGTTVCAQGTVTGSENASPAGPYFPYPCESDMFCDSGSLGVIYDDPSGIVWGGNRGPL